MEKVNFVGSGEGVEAEGDESLGCDVITLRYRKEGVKSIGTGGEFAAHSVSAKQGFSDGLGADGEERELL